MLAQQTGVGSSARGIEYLRLSNRTYHALLKAGIETIDQFMSLSLEDLSKCPGIGATALAEIRRTINPDSHSNPSHDHC